MCDNEDPLHPTFWGVPQWPIYFLMYCDSLFLFHAFSSNYPCHQCLLIFFLSYLNLHTHRGTSIISYFKKRKINFLLFRTYMFYQLNHFFLFTFLSLKIFSDCFVSLFSFSSLNPILIGHQFLFRNYHFTTARY